MIAIIFQISLDSGRIGIAGQALGIGQVSIIDFCNNSDNVMISDNVNCLCLCTLSKKRKGQQKKMSCDKLNFWHDHSSVSSRKFN